MSGTVECRYAGIKNNKQGDRESTFLVLIYFRIIVMDYLSMCHASLEGIPWYRWDRNSSVVAKVSFHEKTVLSVKKNNILLLPYSEMNPTFWCYLFPVTCPVVGAKWHISPLRSVHVLNPPAFHSRLYWPLGSQLGCYLVPELFHYIFSRSLLFYPPWSVLEYNCPI